MVATLMLLTPLFFCGVDFQVRTLDGTSYVGEFVALTSESVTLQPEKADQPTIVPTDDVLHVVASNTPPPIHHTFHVELTAGSQFTCDSIQLAGGRLTLPLGSKQQEFSTEQVSSVSWGQQPHSLVTQWNEIREEEHSSDVIAIRKGMDSLDYLEGIVTAIDKAGVTFDFEGDSIDVPFAKLFGIIFYGNKSETAKAVVRITTDDGIWLASQVNVHDGSIHWKTADGINLDRELSHVVSIDYATDKLRYLSDMQPASLTVTPQLSTSMGGLTKLLYDPQRDRGFLNRPLSLRFHQENTSKSFAKGLALHSRTEASYRLNGEYSRLRTIAGIDPHDTSGSVALLRISGDDKPLYEQLIGSDDEPYVIDVDVSGQRRVTILVDYGDHLDMADRVHLCDLRVVK